VVDEAVYHGGDHSVCGRLKEFFFLWDGWPPAIRITVESSTSDPDLFRRFALESPLDSAV
jgi:hypothetical protein